jgi:hypothetical protein
VPWARHKPRHASRAVPGLIGAPAGEAVDAPSRGGRRSRPITCGGPDRADLSMSGRFVTGPPAAPDRAWTIRRSEAISSYGGGEAEAAGSWVPPDPRASACTQCARRAPPTMSRRPTRIAALRGSTRTRTRWCRQGGRCVARCVGEPATCARRDDRRPLHLRRRGQRRVLTSQPSRRP